ncbi:MAG: hypothetical protein IT426_20735 [Pirellulales bacterium]|nr:hypothetical protein [Pirellulales bacterium]
MHKYFEPVMSRMFTLVGPLYDAFVEAIERGETWETFQKKHREVIEEMWRKDERRAAIVMKHLQQAFR